MDISEKNEAQELQPSHKDIRYDVSILMDV